MSEPNCSHLRLEDKYGDLPIGQALCLDCNELINMVVPPNGQKEIVASEKEDPNRLGPQIS